VDPLLQMVVAVLGAGIGATLASPTDRLFGALIGAMASVGIAEFKVLRTRIKSLQEDINRLREEAHRAQDARTPPVERSDAGVQSKQSPVVTSPPVAETVRPSVAEWRRDLEDEEPPPIAPSTTGPSSRRSTEAPASADVAIVNMLRRFFTGSNTLVRAGVVILFFGVAFLLRYMAEHTHLPIELRLSGVATGGGVLLMLGWRLRSTRAGYALALQGGAVGILYLTVFAALRLYGLLPATIAFPLLVVIAGLSATLAILQNSMSFALLAVTGGFLAPVLASTGEGSHIVLFSYYAVLNAGILAMAWFRAWRPLNIAGFVFTFAIGTAWGVLRYQPEAFASTEPFLVLLFLFYLAIAILFTYRQPINLRGYIDGTLIFGTPIAAFALQSLMLHERLMPLAYSALAMSALYLVVAWTLRLRRRESQTVLVESFTAIGVVFLTLAIPLALDARWNAAAWALEGAALVWIGCRQNRALPRLCGALLSVASGCITATQFHSDNGHVFLPLASYFGVIIQSAAAISSAHILNAYRQRLKRFEEFNSGGLFAWGLWWWSIGGISEILQYWPAHALAWVLIFLSLTTLACSIIHQTTTLRAAKAAALLQLPIMFACAAVAIGSVQHPFINGGWLAWPLAFIGLHVVMHSHEGVSRGSLANALNAGSAWLLCGIFSWELAWSIDDVISGGASWPAIAWAVIPAAFLFWLPRLVTRVEWPFAKNREAYLFIAGVGVAFFLCLWSLMTNVTSSGDTAPLPYCPFLNPLDLAQAFALLILFRYWRFLRAVRSVGFARIDQRLPIPVLAGLGFIWLNAVLLRTLHQWFGVPLGIDQIIASTLVQTSLSIFWAVLALITMLVAARQQRRIVWMIGGGLLVIVIVKLFLVDLSRIGSIERIVSFVGVGILMLIVGYISPIPPGETTHP
jgi:uncharacterized membrane protein